MIPSTTEARLVAIKVKARCARLFCCFEVFAFTVFLFSSARLFFFADDL